MHNRSTRACHETESDSGVCCSYFLMPKKPYPVQHIRMPKAVTETDVVECFFKSDASRSLKTIVTELLPFGSACAEHVLLSAELNPAELFPSTSQESVEDTEKAQQLFRDSPLLKALTVEIKNLEQWFHNCSDNPPRGFILTKGNLLKNLLQRE